MLEELSIKNIALVDSIQLSFTKGFNCLTGETGAGKSILAGALGLIRGNKSELDLIRHDCDEALVSAVFLLPLEHNARLWLEQHGLDTEDDRVVIRRVLKRSGKSGIHIQGQSVALRELADFAGLLFDMHGQHEHQNLFDIDKHRELLDRFGGLADELQEFQEKFALLAKLRKRLGTMKSSETERSNRIIELEYSIREIDDARLQIQEDENLDHERKLLQQAEKRYSLCERVRGALSGDDSGALTVLFSARQALNELANLDSSLAEHASRIETSYWELEDLARGLSDYSERINFDEERIELIEERLRQLSKIKKKYGPRLSDVQNWYNAACAELETTRNTSGSLEELEKEVEHTEKQVLQRANVLSQHRKEAAHTLQMAISENLRSLGMGKARFEISLGPKNSDQGSPVCGLWGIDTVEFMLAPNPGEPLRPIKNSASGGELSRIMLAIKNVLASIDDVLCLVFDEVDTGIGGEVAVSVAEHLKKLSQQKQILAITHLASIATRADNQIRVQKVQADSRTRTLADSVHGSEREKEIARMLSGDTSSDASLRHAAELLQKYHREY